MWRECSGTTTTRTEHILTLDVLVENVEFAGDKAKTDNNTATQAAPQTTEQAQASEQLSYGSLSDFEEILSDGDVPF